MAQLTHDKLGDPNAYPERYRTAEGAPSPLPKGVVPEAILICQAWLLQSHDIERSPFCWQPRSKREHSWHDHRPGLQTAPIRPIPSMALSEVDPVSAVAAKFQRLGMDDGDELRALLGIIRRKASPHSEEKREAAGIRRLLVLLADASQFFRTSSSVRRHGNHWGCSFAIANGPRTFAPTTVPISSPVLFPQGSDRHNRWRHHPSDVLASRMEPTCR